MPTQSAVSQVTPSRPSVSGDRTAHAKIGESVSHDERRVRRTCHPNVHQKRGSWLACNEDLSGTAPITSTGGSVAGSAIQAVTQLVRPGRKVQFRVTLRGRH